MRVRAVFLDVGGVMVVPSGGVVAAALAAAGIPADPAAADLAHHAGTAALDAAGGSWDAYRREWLRRAGVAEEHLPAGGAVLASLLEGPADRLWTEVRPGTADGLRALAGTGLGLAVVSNSDGTVEAILRRFGLCHVGGGPGAQVACVLDSHVVGSTKPDPGIFHLACERCGVEPAEALHVGDTVTADVHGAAAAGVHPVHLDPYGLCADRGHDHVDGLVALAGLLRRPA